MACEKCEFTVIAPEIGDNPETWRWCIRCGMLKLGKDVFVPGPHQKKEIISEREREQEKNK